MFPFPEVVEVLLTPSSRARCVRGLKIGYQGYGHKNDSVDEVLRNMHVTRILLVAGVSRRMARDKTKGAVAEHFRYSDWCRRVFARRG
jgi:hypothetical protein